MKIKVKPTTDGKPKKGNSAPKCRSCGCPCWRSDVLYCWDCYKYQYFESR